MGMNPKTNKFEELSFVEAFEASEADRYEEFISKVFSPSTLPPKLLRPNGEPVPEHWAVFQVDEEVVLKNYTFKVAHIGEKTLLLEPVGIVEIGSKEK